MYVVEFAMAEDDRREDEKRNAMKAQLKEKTQKAIDARKQATSPRNQQFDNEEERDDDNAVAAADDDDDDDDERQQQETEEADDSIQLQLQPEPQQVSHPIRVMKAFRAFRAIRVTTVIAKSTVRALVIRNVQVIRVTRVPEWLLGLLEPQQVSCY